MPDQSGKYRPKQRESAGLISLEIRTGGPWETRYGGDVITSQRPRFWFARVSVYVFISRNFLCSAKHSGGKTWVLEVLVIKPQLLPIQHLCVRPGAPWRVGVDFHPQSYLGVPHGSWSSSHRVPRSRKEGGDPSPSPLRLAGQVQPHGPTRASAGRPGNVTQLRARVSWLKKKGTVGI